MMITFEIPEYKVSEGIKFHWENGFEISVEQSNNETLIRGNKAGLISIAIQLLSLAQDNVPIGTHLHYDEHNSLEIGSKALVIEKNEA